MAGRIVVIGGQGFLGRRAVAALQGTDVEAAGRRGPVRVDLRDPSTFEVLRGASLVVDVSSSHAAPPDALAAWCLQEGLTLLEASSDRTVVERLLALPAEGPGAVVLGAGIFTGLSNLLGAAVGGPVDLGIRSSPFSGAGQGTIDLMVDALAVPARQVRGGRDEDLPTGAPGPTLPFPRGARRTLAFSFPEAVMLRASGMQDAAVWFAPAPSFLWASFRFLPAALMAAGWFRAGMGLYFRVLRRVLLAGVASRVELVARSPTATRTLLADDGMGAAGVAIAAIARLLPARRPRGVACVDAWLGLDEVVAEMRRIDPEVRVWVDHGGAADAVG